MDLTNLAQKFPKTSHFSTQTLLSKRPKIALQSRHIFTILYWPPPTLPPPHASSMAVVLSVGNSPLHHRNRPLQPVKFCFNKRLNGSLNLAGSRLFWRNGALGFNGAPNLFNRSSTSIRSFLQEDAEYSETGSYIDNSEREDETVNVILGSQKNQTTSTRSSLLSLLAILLGIAATITLLSICLKQPNQGSSSGIQILRGGAVTSTLPNVFLSMLLDTESYFQNTLQGCGLFISEEALNIWVGISIARMLTLDGTRQSFVESFSRNAPHILSTVLWVYWGVCISDMIPFYLGRLFKKSGASDDVYSKLGINKDKALGLTRIIQRCGNLIGFVECFSLGVRNPTAFFAGALDISPEYFFAGVCCGGLITFTIQLGVGFLLRERPVFALATVATVVGIWTIFPYVVAASAALFFYMRRRYSN